MYKELPEDWKWEKLGEICKTTSGGTPSRGNKNYYNGNIPWVKSGELDKGLILDTEEKITQEAVKNSSAKIFPKGTLLIALYGATIGKLAFLGVEASTNQAICGIYESNNLDSKYLYNYLLHKKQKLVNQGIGGAQPNISQTILKNLDVPVPSLNTQNAIVSKIEELFSELDKGIENLKTAQQQLKVYRQSVLKWAFEGKLTNGLNHDSFDFSDENDLAMVAESQEVYGSAKNLENQASQKNPNAENKGLPEKWKWTPINQVTYNLDGKRIPLSRTVRSTRKGTFRYYGATEIVDYIDDYLFDGEYILIGEDGANLLSKSKPLAFIVEGKFWVNNHAHVLQSKPNMMNKYLCYFFNSLNIAEFVTGTAQPKLSQGNLNKIKIPICTIEEQIKIVQEIESRLSVADKMEETIQQSLLQAESLRQSILKKAFEGGLIK